MSNRYLRVAQRLKCQRDPYCNFAVRKSNEHSKNLSWFINTKVYSWLHFLVVVEKKKKQRLKIKSTVLPRQRKIKCQKGEKKNSRHSRIIFHAFRCSSRTSFLAGSDHTTSHQGVIPLFWAHPKMGATIFGCLHIVVASLPQLSLHRRVRQLTNSFPVFYPAPFRLSFLRPIRTRCWFAIEKFLLLTRAPAAMMICISTTYFSPSRSFLLFYICSLLEL